MKILNKEQWLDSQRNEDYFWEVEKEKNNLEQIQRNSYYLSIMEGVSDIFLKFFQEHSILNMTIIDIGSGPEGILHILDAEMKIAVDPLMSRYIEMGYDVKANQVITIEGCGENLSSFKIEADIIVSFNALDHSYDPLKTIREIYKSLKHKGYFLLLTDLRPEELLDCYHKLSFDQEEVVGWMELSSFIIRDLQNVPHSIGNSIMQLATVCQKE